MSERSAHLITFKADPEIIRQTKQLARQHDTTISQMLRRLLRQHLEAHRSELAA